MSLHQRIIEDMAYYDAPANPIKVEQYAEELSHLSEMEFLAARKFYRQQPGRQKMPSAADYVQAVPDGRPNVNEAWSLIPKDEYRSVVWCEEMRLAYYDASPHLEEGRGSDAFFAFRDKYSQLVTEARANRKPAKWSMSPGIDVSGRVAALTEAVSKGRMPLDHAVQIHPELEYAPQYQKLALEHGASVTQIDHRGKEKVKALLTGKGPDEKA